MKDYEKPLPYILFLDFNISITYLPLNFNLVVIFKP
jgi:hypothetical protein